MQTVHKKCIYTVITNHYDAVYPPVVDQPGWDMLCFTDNTDIESDFWQILPLPDLPELAGLLDDPVRAARLVKILPHRFLKDYDYSVFIDGNRILNQPMSDYVGRFENADLLCLGSLSADVYSAAEVLLGIEEDPETLDMLAKPPLSDDEKTRLESQMVEWYEYDLPRQSGNPGTAILGRRHNDKKIIDVMETWAQHTLDFSAEDELGLPLACHRHRAEWTEGLSRRVVPPNTYSEASFFATPGPHLAVLRGSNPPPPTEYPKNPEPPGGPYGGYPYLLTIGIPVSNQIGTMRRCLEGIKPLLDNLPAELLIIDTGSTDGTVEVCLEYGARVVEFPWINDMSAARNTGIRNAKGMWYMSMDNDEYFEDVTPFLDFFSAPEQYTRFPAAYYNQLNYSDEFAVSYSKAVALRMARITPKLHFEGRIHDALVVEDTVSPYYFFDADAHHFGFARIYEFFMRDKVQRNVQSLKYDVAEMPYNHRYSFQMQKEYNVVKQPRLSLPYAHHIFSLTRQHKEEDAHFKKSAQGYLFSALVQHESYRQAIAIFEAHIDLDDFGSGDQCALAYLASQAYFYIEDYETALFYCAVYDKAYEQFNKLSSADQAKANEALQYNRHDEATNEFMQGFKLRCYVRTNNFDAFEKHLSNDYLLNYIYKNDAHLPDIMQIIIENNRWQLLTGVAKRCVANNADWLYTFYETIDLMAKPHQYRGIAKAFKEAGAEETALEPLFELRLLEKEMPQAQPLLDKAVEGTAAYVPKVARYFKVAALNEGMRLSLDVSGVFEAMQLPDIDYAYTLLQQPKTYYWERAYSRFAEWQQQTITPQNSMEQYFHMCMGVLVYTKKQAQSEFDEQAYISNFFETIDRVLMWHKALYAEAVMQDDGSPLLPASIQSLLLVKHGIKKQKENDKLAAAQYFKKALELDSDLSIPIKKLTKTIQEELEKEQRQHKAAQSEAAMLAEAIKPKIEQLIDSGFQTEAIPLILQLETLLPNDPDVQALKVKAGIKPTH